jgi:hypothetical protein
LRKLRKKAALEKEPTKILERTIVHIRVGGTIRVKKADTITPVSYSTTKVGSFQRLE